MTGTILNTAAILVGGLLGLRFGQLLSEKSRETIIIGLGLFTIGISVNMFLETNNSPIVLGGLLIGGLLGEYLQIESRLNKLGIRLEKIFNGKSTSPSSGSSFVRGFNQLSIVLYRAHGYLRRYTGRVNRRLPIAGNQIRNGWFCSICPILHAGSRCALFSTHRFSLPGWL